MLLLLLLLLPAPPLPWYFVEGTGRTMARSKS